MVDDRKANKFLEVAQNASGFFLKLAELESHFDTWGRRVFGFSTRTDEGAKKSNIDEVGYIKMLFADGLTTQERIKLAYFMEWSYRIKPERHFLLKMWLLWVRAHNQNDWRDILANASTTAPHPIEIETKVKSEEPEDAEVEKTIDETIPESSNPTEAQKALKEGIAMIRDEKNGSGDEEGFRNAARFWSGVGLPMMPRTETLDAIEAVLKSERIRQAINSLAEKHGPSVKRTLVTADRHAARGIAGLHARLQDQDQRNTRRRGLAKLFRRERT